MGHMLVHAFDEPSTFVCCPQNCLECDRRGACIDSEGMSPLLTNSPFPRFDKIKPSDVVPAIDYLEALRVIRYIETYTLLPQNYTYDQGIAPLARIDERLGRVYSVVVLLSMTINTPEWQSVIGQLQPAMDRHQARLLQDPRYLRNLDTVAASAAAAGYGSVQAAAGLTGTLTSAQLRVMNLRTKQAKLYGADLPSSAQSKLNSINSQLGSLATDFNRRALQSAAAWTKLVTKKQDVAGLPQAALELAAQQARDRQNIRNATAAAGPWLFSLDYVSYYPVVAYGKNRALRELLLRARSSQATESFLGGKYDNTGTILDILRLRASKAHILGFPSFADLSMQTKMATVKTANALESQLTK